MKNANILLNFQIQSFDFKRNFLYKTPPKGPEASPPPSGEKKDELPEYTDNGERGYKDIVALIEKIDPKIFSTTDINNINSLIDNYNFYIENYKDGVQATYLEGYGPIKLFGELTKKLQLNPTEISRYLEDETSYSHLPRLPKEIIAGLCWLSDPILTYKTLSKDKPGIWDNEFVLNIALKLHGVNNFYPYLGYTEIKECLNDLYLNHFDSEAARTSLDERIKSLYSWLSYIKDHCVSETAYNTKEILGEKGQKALIAEKFLLIRSAAELKDDTSVDIFVDNISSESSNPYIDRILHADGKLKEDLSDKDRRLLIMLLFWAFLDSLIKNPNISTEKKVAVHDSYGQKLRKYGYQQYFGPKGEVSEEITGDLPEQDLDAVPEELVQTINFDEKDLPIKGSSKPDYGKVDPDNLQNPPFINAPGKDSPDNKAIDAAYSKYQSTHIELITILESGGKITPEQRDEIVDTSEELRDVLVKTFGTPQIVQLDPSFKEKAEKAVDYYELFSRAVYNASLLPEFETDLKEFGKIKAGKQTVEQFQRAKEIFVSLRDMDYLSSKETSKKRQDLLGESRIIYREWAISMKLAPRLQPNPNPYSAEVKDSEDPLDSYEDESSEYVYSPMSEISEDGEGGFEIPDAMDRQMNHLKLLETLATSLLFAQKMNKENAPYLQGIFTDLDKVQEAMQKHYTDKTYDGKTPFDLDSALKSSGNFAKFLEDTKTFFGIGKAQSPILMALGANTEFEKFIKKQHGDSDSDFNRLVKGAYDLKKSPLYNDLALLLQGGSLTREGIKRAGTAIAIFVRNTLRMYRESRILMAQLLQPHMPKSRQNLKEKSPLLWKNLKEKAHREAEKYILQYMADRGKREFDQAFTEKWQKENNGQTPPPLTLKRAYYAYYDASEVTMTEVLHRNLVNNFALSERYFAAFGKLDATDDLIIEQYRDSVDPDDDNPAYTGAANISDETAEFLRDLGNFFKTIAEEIAILVASIYLTAGVGYLARLAFRGGTLLVKGIMSIAELSRIAKWALRIGEGAVVLTAQGAGFMEIYPLMNKLLTGKHVDDFFDIADKEGWGSAFAALLGEMAMFGSFHAVDFASKFLKYGKAGRGLLWLGAKNPEYGNAVNAVFKSLEKLNPSEALKAVEEMAAKGAVNVGGKAVALPAEIKAFLKDTVLDVTQLQKQYMKLVQGFESETLKKVLTFMIRDLAFDMFAMTIGTMAKEGIYKGDIDLARLLSAESIAQMYLMGFAFRGAFGASNKTIEVLGAKFKGLMTTLKVNSLMELIPALEISIINGRAKKTELGEAHSRAVKEVDSQLSGIQGEIATAEVALSAKTSKMGRLSSIPSKKEPNAKTQDRILLLQSEITELQAKIQSLKQQADPLRVKKQSLVAEHQAQLAKLDLEIAEAEKAKVDIQVSIDQMPLGDFLVPSRVARILPKCVREHIYRQYRAQSEIKDAEGNVLFKKGQFLGSEGFVVLLRNDFASAIKMLEGAKRSILTPKQALAVLLELSPNERFKLLDKMSNLFTRGQRKLMVFYMEQMEIPEKQIPRDFNPRSPYRSRALAYRNLLLGVILGASLKMVAPAFADTGPTQIPNRATVVEVVHGDFAPKGDLFIAEPKYDALPNGGNDSPMLILSTETRGKGEDAKLIADSSFHWGAGGEATKGVRDTLIQRLFSNDPEADFGAILGATEALLQQLEKTDKRQGELTDQMQDYWDRIPEEYKPFMRIIPQVRGKNVKFFVIVDNEALQEYERSAKELEEGETYSFIQTLKEIDLMEENLGITDGSFDFLSWDALIRRFHDLGAKTDDFFLYAFFTALGLRFAAGRKYKRLGGKESDLPSSKRIVQLSLKHHWLSLAFMGARVLFSPLKRIPITEDLPGLTEKQLLENTQTLSRMRSVRDILGEAEYNALPDPVKSRLEADSGTLKENLKYMNFDNPQQLQNFYEALIKINVQQLKIEGLTLRLNGDGTPANRGLLAERAELETRVAQLEADANVQQALQLRSDIAAKEAEMQAFVTAALAANSKAKPKTTVAYKALKTERDGFEGQLTALKGSDPTLDTNLSELDAKRAERDTKTGEISGLEGEIQQALTRVEQLSPEVSKFLLNTTQQVFSVETLLGKNGEKKILDVYLETLRQMEGVSSADIQTMKSSMEKGLTKLKTLLQKYPNIKAERKTLIEQRMRLDASKPQYDTYKALLESAEFKGKTDAALTPAQRAKKAQAEAFIKDYDALNKIYEQNNKRWSIQRLEIRNSFSWFLDSIPKRLLGTALGTSAIMIIMNLIGGSFGALGFGNYDEDVEEGEGGGLLVSDPRKTGRELEEKRKETEGKAAEDALKGAPGGDDDAGGAGGTTGGGGPKKVLTPTLEGAPQGRIETGKAAGTDAKAEPTGPTPEQIKARATEVLDQMLEIK